MIFLEKTLICLVFLDLTSANPWHLKLPIPLNIPNTEILQQAMSLNFTYNLNTILASFKGFGNATSCTSKLSKLTSSLVSINPESLAFIDALGKPGPGLTAGNFLWLGDYEMCGTGALENKSTGYSYKNCVVSAALTLGEYPFPFTWTGCSPPECKTKDDLQDTFKQIAALINKSGIIHTDPSTITWDIICDVKQEFDTGAYAAVTIASFFGILVVVGTMWRLLEPIITSFLEYSKDITTVLFDVQENPHEDLDKQVPSTIFRTTNQPGWLPGRYIECFALQRTMETLFSATTKPGQVLCLNGIRVLSINWVVLGHVYGFSYPFLGGHSYAAELIKRRNFMLVFNGLPTVDSFFALSGFLVTYLLLKQLSKRGSLTPLQWIMFYTHRYVRLTIPYLITMLIEGWLYRFIMTGPRAQQMTTTAMSSHKMCEQYWYTNLLYINNFVPWKATGACLGQSWYLANDMQFFVLAPLFILLLFRKPIFGVLATSGTIICSAVAAAVITAYYHLGPADTVDNNQDNFWLLYNKPWIRIIPYLVGILGGWFYWKYGEQITQIVRTLPEWKKVVFATPIWAVTAAVEYSVVFGLYNDVQNLQQKDPSELDSVSYRSLARIAWSLSLTTQILFCQCGLGGFINSLLSWSGWQILSRLTYSVYLLHLGLITVLYGQMRHTLFLNPDFEFAVLYLGVLAMSYLCAAVLYLTVEQPVANLEAITYRKSS